MSRAQLFERVLVGLALLVGFGLRAAALVEPIRYDEAFTYLFFASEGLAYAASAYTHPNNHILNTLGVVVASELLGNHPWVLRLPAFLAGCALLPLCHGWLRRRSNAQVALLATAWLAVSGPLVLSSANARGYSLQALLVVAAVWIGDALRRAPATRLWAALAIVMALGFWTLPTMLYAFGGIMLWLGAAAARAPDPRAWWRGWLLSGLGAAVLTLLFYGPVLWASGVTSIVSNEFTRPQAWDALALRLRAAPALLSNEWGSLAPVWLKLLWLVGAAAAVVAGARRDRGVPLWLALVVWCALLVVVQRALPPARVWLFALPPALGLAALGVSAALRWLWPARAPALVGLLAALGLASGAQSVAAQLRELRDDPDRPDHVARWLAERAAAAPLEFAAHFDLGHRVLYYALRDGAQVAPSLRGDAVLAWRWPAARADASRERLLLHEPEADRELAEFVSRLERHLGSALSARPVHRFGDIEVRALASGIVSPEPQRRAP